MTSLAFITMDLLWRNALAAIPVAIVVAIICRWLPCRSSTRHALWVLVLISLLAPPMLPSEHVDALWQRVTAAVKTESDSKSRSDVAAAPVSAGPVELSTVAAPTNQVDKPTAPTATVAPAVECESVATPRVEILPRLAAAPVVSIERSALPTISLARSTVPYVPGFDETARHAATPIDSCESDVNVVCDAQQTDCNTRNAAVPVVDPCADIDPCEPCPNVMAASSYLPGSEIVLFGDRPAQISKRETHLDTRIALVAVMARSVFDWCRRSVGGSVESMQVWVGQLAAVRDAVAGVRPIPVVLWIGGCLVLAGLFVIRFVRFHHILRDARPAPIGVRREVAEAAAALELRIAPIALIVDKRVSPLVWCGRRRVLILPRELWNDLDETGRNAVLLHELAHLKRRDHWVCWLEMIVGAVYWWHPLVWIICHRVREEADNCCDAWVTQLLPAAASRGAYARALLATRQYLGDSRVATPAMGLGVTSARAKRFARRLTMVMTERSTPRLSVLGASLIVCVAAAAWLSAPLFACPPEEQTPTPSAAAKAPKAPRAPRAVIAIPRNPAPPAIVEIPAPPAPPDASTFERHMRERAHQPSPAPGAFGDEGDLRMRLQMLEERLNRLTEQLERLNGQGPGPGGAQGMGTTVAPRMQGMGGGAVSIPRIAQRGQWQNEPGGAVAWAGPADNGETIARVYQLPEGKLEALVALMARQDVPIFISQKDGGIEVNATPRQHEIFAGFIAMIDPEGRQPAHGAGAAINHDHMRQAIEEAARAGAAVNARDVQGAVRKAMQEQRRVMEQQRSRMKDQAKELYRRAKELEGRADALQEQAEALEDELAQEQMLAQADALYAQASEFEAQADAVDSEADAVSDHIDEMMDEADAADEEVEAALEAELSALEEGTVR